MALRYYYHCFEIEWCKGHVFLCWTIRWWNGTCSHIRRSCVWGRNLVLWRLSKMVPLTSQCDDFWTRNLFFYLKEEFLQRFFQWHILSGIECITWYKNSRRGTSVLEFRSKMAPLTSQRNHLNFQIKNTQRRKVYFGKPMRGTCSATENVLDAINFGSGTCGIKMVPLGGSANFTYVHIFNNC